MAWSREAIEEAMRQAKTLEHPMRAVRVQLECAHLQLRTWQNFSEAAIGNYTACNLCPGTPSRLIVDVAETGTLHDDWFQ